MSEARAREETLFGKKGREETLSCLNERRGGTIWKREETKFDSKDSEINPYFRNPVIGNNNEREETLSGGEAWQKTQSDG